MVWNHVRLCRIMVIHLYGHAWYSLGVIVRRCIRSGSLDKVAYHACNGTGIAKVDLTESEPWPPKMTYVRLKLADA